VKSGDKSFTENRVCVTDASFFNIFTFQFIKSNFKTALSDQNTAVITEDIGKKYFGDSEPLGKTLTFDNRTEYVITGIIQNIPSNSDIRYDIFIPVSKSTQAEEADTWGSHWLQTYILLQEDVFYEEVEHKLSALIKEHLPEENISLVVQPFNKIHLYSIEGQPEGMKYIYFFSVIALFILIIACINFMNLSTARSVKRAKEVGLRKVIGANKAQIIRQFFSESVLYTLIALAIAIVLVEFIRPAFNELTGKNLALDYSNFRLIVGLMIIAVFTGILSGSYPALFLSSFQPAKVLRGMSKGKNKNSLRKLLVVIQFSLSIILLICTGIIYSQLKFIQRKDLGFKKENIVYVTLDGEMRDKYETVKTELLKQPEVMGVTKSSSLPTEIWSIMRGLTWEGKETEEGAAFSFASVDYDYFETLNMEMVQGRSFSKEFTSDSNNIIFNETAIKVMGMDSPVGKLFSFDEADEASTIIGVVKDFHFLPITYEIEPLIIVMDPDYDRYLLIKTNSENLISTISNIEKVWGGLFPEYPFEYHFLDEQFESTYQNEIRLGQILGYFVILTIFISCLGLFGLASFTAEQRTKEIGIRKVHGASIPNIVIILSKEFAKWVLLANIIAWPVAYFAMNKWLQNFAYKTEIGFWVFILSGSLALFIALFTVSSQAIRAATANPVDALKYE
ncbi:MAG: ABC transporter permease, partial [Candidatus Aminicenantes bacterium]|nr:ABC transporter permease [Candidatus Aminicenantes bacterium]